MRQAERRVPKSQAPMYHMVPFMCLGWSPHSLFLHFHSCFLLGVCKAFEDAIWHLGYSTWLVFLTARRREDGMWMWLYVKVSEIMAYERTLKSESAFSV